MVIIVTVQVHQQQSLQTLIIQLVAVVVEEVEVVAVVLLIFHQNDQILICLLQMVELVSILIWENIIKKISDDAEREAEKILADAKAEALKTEEEYNQKADAIKKEAEEAAE